MRRDDLIAEIADHTGFRFDEAEALLEAMTEFRRGSETRLASLISALQVRYGFAPAPVEN